MGKKNKSIAQNGDVSAKPKRGFSFRNLFDQPFVQRTMARSAYTRPMHSEGDLRGVKSDTSELPGNRNSGDQFIKGMKSSGPNAVDFYSSNGIDKSATSELPAECPLCLQILPGENFPYLLSCSHRSCRDCLRQYMRIEIMESRVNLTCPECDTPFHPTDIQLIIDDSVLLQKYEEFMLRRVLVTDPDIRWCPAPDCGYAVIASGCASCPKIVCQRPNCGAKFCYHCKQLWHPNKTCDASRAERALLTRSLSFSVTYSNADTITANTGAIGEMKSCPRCGAYIMKMDDGSCNHMVCAICGAEFCWLCLKEISDLHYLSPSGCTFWGKKPWSRKKKVLWQLGMLVGAPVVIALIAGIAVPAIMIGVPIWVGRKLYNKHRSKNKHKRNAIIVASVSGTILVSPLLAAAAVSLGVPVMLAYVYGVVPISLCRSEGCGASGEGGRDEQANVEEEAAEAAAAAVVQLTVKDAELQADESSIGTAGPSLYNHPAELNQFGGGDVTDRESTSTRAVAGYSLCDEHSVTTNRLEVHADVAQGQGQNATFNGSKTSLSINTQQSPNSSQMSPVTTDVSLNPSVHAEELSGDQLLAVGQSRHNRLVVRKHSALVSPVTVAAQSVQFAESGLVFESNAESRRAWFNRHSLSVGDQLHEHIASSKRSRHRGNDGSFGCVSEKSSVGGVLSYDDHLHQFGTDGRVAMTVSSIASPDESSNISLTLHYYGDSDVVDGSCEDVLEGSNPIIGTLPEVENDKPSLPPSPKEHNCIVSVATSVQEVSPEVVN